MEQSKFVHNKRLHAVCQLFLIASVATVLVIRFYLASTGYPKVGTGGLHISHMLWGGLMMLIALVLLLAFPTGRMQSSVALLGGIGFAFFIDELGKFLTSDNNYFFSPTLAFIYMIYLLLLLTFMGLERLAAPADPPIEGSSRILRGVRQLLLLFPGSPYYIPALAIFFSGYLLLLVVSGLSSLRMATAFVSIAWSGASFVYGIMLLIGIISLRGSRITAYTWFKRAILASTLLTTFFLFSLPPLSLRALQELLLNLVILSFIEFMLYNDLVT